jgi:glucose/arabinose dehydrogenase
MRIFLTAASMALALPLQAAQQFETKLLKIEAEPVMEFSHPWGMTMLPSGDILVTERRGRLWRVSGGG